MYKQYYEAYLCHGSAKEFNLMILYEIIMYTHKAFGI